MLISVECLICEEYIANCYEYACLPILHLSREKLHRVTAPLDGVLKNFKLDKYFITAGKSILYLVNLQSLVAKYCKIRKI